jgi:uncharacterized protein YjdB
LSLSKGATGTLTATIAPPQPTPTEVLLTSSDPAVVVPASVTVPIGATTAAIPVHGQGVTATAVTLTAGPLNGSSQTASITVTAPELVSLTVARLTASISKGQTQAFTAVGTYTDGSTQDLTSGVAWSSSDPSIAFITATGLVTGLTQGSTTITAMAGTVSGSAPLTVTAPTLASLAVSPATATLPVGQSLQFAGVGTLTDGTTQDVTSAVTWTSSNALVAGLSAAGLITTLSPGTVTITATHPRGLTANATLTVLPPLSSLARLEPASLTLAPGGTGSLTVTLSAAPATDTALTLISSDPTIVAVPSTLTVPAGALTAVLPLTGLAPGTATITATLNSTSLQSTVTVRSGPTLTSLMPPTLAVAPGASGTFTITLSADADADTPVTLTTSNSGMLGVPTEGIVVIPAGQRSQTVTVAGIETGHVTFIVTLNGSSVQSEVTVTNVLPAVVSLLPAVASLVAMDSATFTVKLNAAQDVPVEVGLTQSAALGPPFFPSVLTIPAGATAADFTVTAVLPGAGFVTAALNGSSVGAALDVHTAPPAVQALVCPGAIAAGATGWCTVTVRPQGGDTEIMLSTTTPDLVQAPASVTITANTASARFAVTGIAPGEASVIAAAPAGVSQQASVTVVSTPPVLASVLPAPATLAEGAVTTVTVSLSAAQATDTTIPVTLSAPGIVRVPATVTVPAGSLNVPVPVTALAPGVTTLALGPLNGTQTETTVTVNALPPTVTAVTPAELTIYVGSGEPLTVRLSAAQAEATVLPVASSDPSIVLVPTSVTVPAGAISVLVE